MRQKELKKLIDNPIRQNRKQFYNKFELPLLYITALKLLSNSQENKSGALMALEADLIAAFFQHSLNHAEDREVFYQCAEACEVHDPDYPALWILAEFNEIYIHYHGHQALEKLDQSRLKPHKVIFTPANLRCLIKFKQAYQYASKCGLLPHSFFEALDSEMTEVLTDYAKQAEEIFLEPVLRLNLESIDSEDLEVSMDLFVALDRTGSDLKYLSKLLARKKEFEVQKRREQLQQWSDLTTPYLSEFLGQPLTLACLQSLIQDHDQESKATKLKALFEQSLGDMAFYDSLKELHNELKGHLDTELGVWAQKACTEITCLMRVIYKTRNLDEDLLNRLQRWHGQSFKKAEEAKLSMAEASLLADLACLMPTFSRWFKNQNPDLQPKLMAHCQHAAAFCEKFESDISNQVHRYDTLLAFTHIKKQRKLTAKPLSHAEKWAERLTQQVTVYCHTATIHQGQSGLTQTHLKTAFQRHENRITHFFLDEELSFKDFIRNDFFKLEISNLVPPSHHRYLEALLGADWPRVLNKKYRKIERSIHEELEADNLTPNVDTSVHNKIGLKSFLLPKLSQKSVHRWQKKNRVQSLFFQYNERGQVPMLCSQYTAFSIVLALDELNHELRDKARKKELKVPVELFSPAMPAHQNLNMMHPGQVFKALNKQGCLTPVESVTLKRFVHI